MLRPKTSSGVWMILLAGLFVSILSPASGLNEIDSRATETQQRILETQKRIETNGYHWRAGKTSLSHLTADEKQQMLGDLGASEEQKRQVYLPVPIKRDLPESWDWRQLDGVTPVTHQGGCGSCWDFAGIAAMESMIKIYGGIELDLSEQQVLSCATFGYGCGGGWSDSVWKHARDFGITTEACMPYMADDEVPCTEEGCVKVASANEWYNIPNGIDEIKTAIAEFGPVKTSFYVYGDFYDYDGGCYEHADEVSGTNHAILVIGWDDNACGNNGAWLCKNSWGDGWGEDGFFWMKYGNSNMGTATMMVTYYEAVNLELSANAVDDLTCGDGDLWLDPGEEASLIITIRNALLADTRTGISALLSCDNEYITIINNTASGGDLAAGETTVLSPSFTVTADPFMPIGEEVTFTMAMTADSGYMSELSFTITTGDVPLLLIDDDNCTVADPYLREAMAAEGILFRHFDTARRGSPTGDLLARYEAVIWATGISGRFGDNDQLAVSTYLDGGGALLATGQDIGWYIHGWNSATDEDSLFYRNYLHAEYLEDGSGYETLTGFTGDPISDGMNFGINGGDGSRAQAWPSRIAPLGDAVAFLEYAPGVTGAVRWSGSHRVAYFAFGIEAIDFAVDRQLVIRRTLDWLVGDWPDIVSPVVELAEPNGGETLWPMMEFDITWNATDNVGVESVDLYLSRDDGATYSETIVTGLANTGLYSWLPTGPAATECRIKVLVHDAAQLPALDYSDEPFRIVDETATTADSELAFSFTTGTPNPFVKATSLHLDLPQSTRIDLGIFDLSGRRIQTLSRGDIPGGSYDFVWQGTDNSGQRLPGGIYFVRLQRDNKPEMRHRLLLLK